jgi:hypothetical protein
MGVLLDADSAAPALVHAGDRLHRVSAALLLADGSYAFLDSGPIDAAGALMRIEVVGDAAAELLHAHAPRRILLTVTNVIARLFAIAPGAREVTYDGGIKMAFAALGVGDAHLPLRRRAGLCTVIRVLATKDQHACARQRNCNHHMRGVHDVPNCRRHAGRRKQEHSGLEGNQASRDLGRNCLYMGVLASRCGATATASTRGDHSQGGNRAGRPAAAAEGAGATVRATPTLSGGPATRDEPKDHGDHRQDEQYVNESARDMKRRETKHPQDEKHDCDYPK